MANVHGRHRFSTIRRPGGLHHVDNYDSRAGTGVPIALVGGDATSSLVSFCTMPDMDLVRSVVVFDAADLPTESAFWAGILRGQVFESEAWHSVIDAAGEWRIGVQFAPDHVAPQWPDGAPQQVHLDLHVEDPALPMRRPWRSGARLLQSAPDLDSEEGHQVYADPAGHPFCIGWGHPSREALLRYVAASR